MDRMTALREGHPKLEMQEKPWQHIAVGVTDADRIAYNSKLDSYFAEAEDYLRKSFLRAYKVFRMPRLELVLTNTGNGSATNSRIVLNLEEGLRFWSPDVLPPEHVPPKTPTSPHSNLLPSSLPPLEDEFHKDKHVSSMKPAFSFSSNGRTTSFEVGTLVHNAPIELPKLYVGAVKYLKTGNFTVGWTLTCSELLRPSNGQLHVTFASIADETKGAGFEQALKRRYVTILESLELNDPDF